MVLKDPVKPTLSVLYDSSWDDLFVCTFEFACADNHGGIILLDISPSTNQRLGVVCPSIYLFPQNSDRISVDFTPLCLSYL